MSKIDLKDLAYTSLKRKIINCEFSPGTMLNETQMSHELGFSRTPIRSALTRLEFEGLVEILPKKGIHVKSVSLNDVRQIFQVRYEIEPIALMLAGESLPEKDLLYYREVFSGSEEDSPPDYIHDTDMHLFIINHCGNRFIIDLMKKVFDENTRVIISSGQNTKKIHDAQKEHLEIIESLIQKDISRAMKAMKKHIESCKIAALDFFYNM